MWCLLLFTTAQMAPGRQTSQEADGPWRDHHRTGTGDHQASAAWFYHPRLKDIGCGEGSKPLMSVAMWNHLCVGK